MLPLNSNSLNSVVSSTGVVFLVLGVLSSEVNKFFTGISLRFFGSCIKTSLPKYVLVDKLPTNIPVRAKMILLFVVFLALPHTVAGLFPFFSCCFLRVFRGR